MSTPSDPFPQGPQISTIRSRRARGWLIISTIAIAAALTGAVASRAVGQQPPWHGPGFMSDRFDPVRVEEGADRAIRHLAVEADATPEQQEKLRAIAKGLVKDLLPLPNVQERHLSHTSTPIILYDPLLEGHLDLLLLLHGGPTCFADSNAFDCA